MIISQKISKTGEEKFWLGLKACPTSSSSIEISGQLRLKLRDSIIDGPNFHVLDYDGSTFVGDTIEPILPGKVVKYSQFRNTAALTTYRSTNSRSLGC